MQHDNKFIEIYYRSECIKRVREWAFRFDERKKKEIAADKYFEWKPNWPTLAMMTVGLSRHAGGESK